MSDLPKPQGPLLRHIETSLDAFSRDELDDLVAMCGGANADAVRHAIVQAGRGAKIRVRSPLSENSGSLANLNQIADLAARLAHAIEVAPLEPTDLGFGLRRVNGIECHDNYEGLDALADFVSRLRLIDARRREFVEEARHRPPAHKPAQHFFLSQMISIWVDVAGRERGGADSAMVSFVRRACAKVLNPVPSDHVIKEFAYKREDSWRDAVAVYAHECGLVDQQELETAR